MSTKTEDKPAAPAKDAHAAAPAPKGKLLGPLLAVIVLVGIGVGAGMSVSSFLHGMQAKGTGKGDGHGKDAGKDGHGETPGDGADKAIDPAATREIVIGDLVTNVPNQQGRRYVKITCVIWVADKDALKIASPNNEAIQPKRLLQSALEERMKFYTLEDLTSQGIMRVIRDDFETRIERELHELFRTPREYRYIKRVIVSNLLVQ